MFKIEKLPYPILLLVHAFFGIMISVAPFTGKALIIVIMGYLIYRVLYSGDKDNEVLLAGFYFVALEVFFRMTRSVPLYEMGKYFILIIVVIGIFFRGFSVKSISYVLYILLFIPSMFITAANISLDDNLRKMLAFNLSGPVILGVVAIYFYNRKISKERFLEILGLVVAAIAMMTVYLVLVTPDLEEAVTGTGSNFATSGGFGPNQVSTALGIGMFCAFVRFILKRSLVSNFIDLALFLLFTYRGYLTFSRGGVLTAIMMIIAFVGTIILFNRSFFKASQIPKFFIIVGGVVVAFLYTAAVTGGQITNRYTNRNALGVEKDDITTGRGDLAASEYMAFMENPLLGVGAGMVRSYRLRTTGINSASHNEVSRLMAEHGAIGIFSIILLIIVPLFYRLSDKSNLFFFSFIIFWAATINHSAMRIAAPSFIYGLCLLRFEKPIKKTKRRQEEEPDEFVEFMREKKLLPKKPTLPELP